MDEMKTTAEVMGSCPVRKALDAMSAQQGKCPAR